MKYLLNFSLFCFFQFRVYVCLNILIYLQNQMKMTFNVASQPHKLSKKFSVQTEIGYGQPSSNSRIKSTQEQISQLKYAAHQSFLQVMQMESLHQEQLQAAKSEFNKLLQVYKQREHQLLNKVTHLENQMKSYHFHFIDIGEDTLDILPQNLTVQAISQCSEQSQQISDIIKIIGGATKKDLSGFEASLFQEISKYISSTKAQEIAKKFTDKVEQYIDQYCIKAGQKIEKTSIWKTKYQQLNTKYQILQSKYQYSQKQQQHLKEHLKKLNANKMQLEQKASQLKNKLNHIENQFKNKKAMKQNISSQCNPLLSSKSNREDLNHSFEEQMKHITTQIKNIVRPGCKLKRLNTFSCNPSTPLQNQNTIKKSKPSEILNNENDFI